MISISSSAAALTAAALEEVRPAANPEADPELAAKPEADADLEAEPELAAKPEADPALEAKPAEPELAPKLAEPELAAKPEADPELAPNPAAPPAANLDADPVAEPELLEKPVEEPELLEKPVEENPDLVEEEDPEKPALPELKLVTVVESPRRALATASAIEGWRAVTTSLTMTSWLRF